VLVQKLKALRDLVIPPFEVPKVSKDIAWLDEQIKLLQEESKREIYKCSLDTKFWLTDLKWMKRIIEWERTNHFTYFRDAFDCEDFALYFMVSVARHFKINQIGAVFDYEAAHAYNLIFFPDNKHYLYEPQDDRLWEVAKHIPKEPHQFKKVLLFR